MKEQTETLTEDKEKLLSENEKLEKQQKKLQQEINKMAQSDTIDRLQEKAVDLGRLERHFGRKQVQSIVDGQWR